MGVLRLFNKKNLTYALFVAMPLIMYVMLLLLARGNGSYHPFNSDELNYWRELYNEFAENQSVTGLNIYAGHETQVGNFSSHGVGPSVLWFLPGLILGWHMNSIPIFNGIIVSVSFLIFLLLVKPKTRTVWNIAIAYAALSVVWLYGLSSMMEIPGFGMGLLWVAALLYRFRNDTAKADLIMLLIYLFTGLYRIVYFVFFLPVVLLILSGRGKLLTKCLLLFAYAVGSFLIYYLSQVTTTAYPFGFMYCEFGQAVGIKEKLIVTFYHGISNLKNWFDLRSEAVVLVISRYAFTVFVIFVYYIVIKKLVKREKLTEGFFMELSVALTLSAAWALQILFYDVFDWRDYRVLYQLAWFGVVVVILNEYKVVQKLYFATQFVTLALATFNMDAYFSPLEAESYSAIMSEVRYDVNADSRWDNTIYNDIGANQALCLLPEQGIGITFGPIIGNEEYIVENQPGYIVTMNEIDISGYEYKAESNGMRLYIQSQ